nr:AsmA family protein [Oceanococcus sp. HetDA_MAG_MS8]
MALPLKILLAFVGLTGLTISGVLIWVLAIFDPNDYRDDISQAVLEKTGRELELSGPIELRLFPFVGAEINDVRLANAQGFGPEPMVQIGQVQAEVELWPLLTQNTLRVGQVRVADLSLRLETRAESTNWDDLASLAEQDSGDTVRVDTEDGVVEVEESGNTTTIKTPEKTTVIVQKDTPMDIYVAGVELTNISLVYSADEERTELTLDQLRTGPIAPGETSTIALLLRASLPDDLQAQVELESDWTFDPEGPLLELSQSELRVTTQGPSVPGGKQTAIARGGARYDGAQQHVEVSDWRLENAGMQATFNADLDLSAGQPQGSASLQTNAFVAQEFSQRFGIPLGDGSPGGPTQLALNLSLEPQRIRSTRLQGQLDGAPFNGSVSVVTLEPPQLRAQFQLDRFDLDNWTPPTAEEEPEESGDESGPDPLDQPLPLDMLAELDIEAKATIGEFLGAGVKAKNVTWQARARPGQAFTSELTMQAYGGQLKASNTVDFSKNTPKTGLQLSMAAVGLGPLLQDTIGEQWLSGLTQLDLDLEAVGTTPRQLLASAAGQASYLLKDGAVQGVSLVDIINQGLSKTKAAEDTQAATSFSEFAGKILFSSGQAKAQNLRADSELLAVSGTGGLNMEALAWDMQLLPTLKDHPVIRKNKGLDKLIGLAVPVQISGPLTAPRFQIDVEGALKARAQQELDAKKQELKQDLDQRKEELKDEAKDKLRGKLQDLFGGNKDPQ